VKSSRHNRPKKPSTKPSLRIIAGQWRGRKLDFAELPGLRPTHDRIRETLFNWLTGKVEGAHCLDLFAGSGALGLEALSRLAADCLFVEHSSQAARTIEGNLKLLDCQNGRVQTGDALAVVKSLPDQAYDLIFLDPPFGQQWLNQLVELPDLQRVLKPGGLIYIEREKNSDFIPPWPPVREKSTSSLIYGLYQPD
jgi:16S rRNA (guanine966-N2)-methyltransferase